MTIDQLMLTSLLMGKEHGQGLIISPSHDFRSSFHVIWQVLLIFQGGVLKTSAKTPVSSFISCQRSLFIKHWKHYIAEFNPFLGHCKILTSGLAAALIQSFKPTDCWINLYRTPWNIFLKNPVIISLNDTKRWPEVVKQNNDAVNRMKTNAQRTEIPGVARQTHFKAVTRAAQEFVKWYMDDLKMGSLHVVWGW